MTIRIYPENPNDKYIAQVVDILQNDGVIIYPTDSVYAFGCSLHSLKAIDKLKTISGKLGNDLSIVCPDLSTISTYAKVDNPTFKLLKRNTPGPFTFILNASGKVPEKFLEKKKTVGIRIPDNNIALAITSALGYPLVSSSVKDRNSEIEYTTDPSLIYEKYASSIDLLVDGGYGNMELTTIVDCTSEEPEIIREGIGELL